ncbi:hypothetical protein [Bordetella flabilis]|uniref:Uncharacterized protein n=1 Tax=Bordetella flabilis TaxID=463014 RepID=A0A193GLB6_9BORD|nr:hypothetical protein [Bordetella flabilis]ANN80887.1 hypothetical protein BAU07_26565 [Bordetella flabilis]
MSLELELVADVRQALRSIERIVLECAFDSADDDWSEVERTFDCGEAYVSFSLCTDPGDIRPSVRIELGVQDESSRHPTAGFKAQWNREEGTFGQVQSILIDGKQCGAQRFLRRLEGTLALAGVSVLCD